MDFVSVSFTTAERSALGAVARGMTPSHYRIWNLDEEDFKMFANAARLPRGPLALDLHDRTLRTAYRLARGCGDNSDPATRALGLTSARLTTLRGLACELEDIAKVRGWH